MNMKRFCGAMVLLMVLQISVKAQQIPHFTHYMFNTYTSNPAVAGTFNFYQIRYNNRFQWVGMTDAPQTYLVSAYGPHSSKDMGFGGYLYSDITGPTSRLGANFSYAYNMPIDDMYRISGGISLGFMQYKVDGSRLDLGDFENTWSDDAAVLSALEPSFTPDASVGFYLYSTQLFVGLSAHQLFGQKVSLVPDNEQTKAYGINRLRQHFMLTGGYKIFLNRDYAIEPSAMIKYMVKSPLQFEVNGKITYSPPRGQEVWAGLSVRWQDAVALLIGINYNKKYMFGYSFDYSYTGIRKYQSGTHEIMIGVMFDKLK